MSTESNRRLTKEEVQARKALVLKNMCDFMKSVRKDVNERRDSRKRTKKEPRRDAGL